MRSDTAHQTWNEVWSTAEGRARWLQPEPDVVEVVNRLLSDHSGPLRALDLGCGIGRHALLLAQSEFETTAIDLAEQGLAQLRQSAEAEGLTINTRSASMTDLPLEDVAFDYVLSFNVIYHGDPDIVRKTLDEIRRVLTPGGTFQATMLSKRNIGFGRGTEVAPNTFVYDAGKGEDADKVHPHFYCNASELVGLLSGFELKSLRDVDQKGTDHWHWHFVAERLA